MMNGHGATSLRGHGPQHEPRSRLGDPELLKYMQFLDIWHAPEDQGKNEAEMTPLFTWPVKEHLQSGKAALNLKAAAKKPELGDFLSDAALLEALSIKDVNSESTEPTTTGVQFGQFSVLGRELPSRDRPSRALNEQPVFLHSNCPWSTFICGSQGSGKSHLLSCILENCLLKSELLGVTPKPMAGIAFAYDANGTANVCEIASLSTHIPVNLLVSPTNFTNMSSVYYGMSNVTVKPLFFNQKHLNTQRMMRLMALDGDDVPLYVDVIVGILKSMVISNASTGGGLDYRAFLSAVKDQGFDKGQSGPLRQRLNLLDDFMDQGELAEQLATKLGGLGFFGAKKQKHAKRFHSEELFKVAPGTLTIVDLSDPFVDSVSACVLFDMCLSLFMENKDAAGKIVVVDEAHKFMGDSAACEILTQHLITTIREQRHSGTRVVIATQEPTISPQLLDLCTMTFIHRFTSPEWLRTLEQHLAGAAKLERSDQNGLKSGELFAQILDLQVGESLVFSPTAVLDVENGKISRLGSGHLKFKTRARLTTDKGKSVMALGVA